MCQKSHRNQIIQFDHAIQWHLMADLAMYALMVLVIFWSYLLYLRVLSKCNSVYAVLSSGFSI